MAPDYDHPLAFLPAEAEKFPRERPFVAVVRTLSELEQALRDTSSGLQWLQVEELLGDPEAWALAAQGADRIPLDVLLSAPGEEFSDLYRLADVRAGRSVRVTMPATSGFLRALRLAASLGLPVRLLPGNPSVQALEELAAALDFYLHDPMVEAPIEFFHSALAWMRGAQTGSLWTISEEDPAVYRHHDVAGTIGSLRVNTAERDFVPKHIARLVDEGAECASCRWQQLCQGYFKWPEASYSCHGVKEIFTTLHAAAEEIGQDLAVRGARQLDGSTA